MDAFKTENLGIAWIKVMSLIIRKGELIYDDEERLKEVRNLYVTIDDVKENDPIIQKYADADRVALMKKSTQLAVLLVIIK